MFIQDPLEFMAHELQKHFKMGDHVKVIGGRYEGDTGLIVRVEDNMVVLFADLTMHEVGNQIRAAQVYHVEGWWKGEAKRFQHFLSYALVNCSMALPSSPSSGQFLGDIVQELALVYRWSFDGQVVILTSQTFGFIHKFEEFAYRACVRA